jgi:hypothetical protein
MKNWMFPCCRKTGRRLLVPVHQYDFAAEMLLVKLKCFFAMSRIIDIHVKL